MRFLEDPKQVVVYVRISKKGFISGYYSADEFDRCLEEAERWNDYIHKDTYTHAKTETIRRPH